MSGSYNSELVFASYCVAVIAAYSAIYFGTRVYDLEGGIKKFWLTLGALCLGGGIWSMHFVGMSAYQMPHAMEMTFSLPLTLASLIPATLASWLALYVITLPQVSKAGIAVCSLIMGTGIFCMHYLGMYAMQMSPAIQYDSRLVAASGLIAVAASGAAMVICRQLRDIPKTYAIPAKAVAALVMGAAICGMHYTGMAAASYPMHAVAAADNSLRGDWMGIPTAITAALFLLLIVYLGYADFREMARAKKARQELQQAAARMAFYDSATGLGNRSFLEQCVLDKLRVDQDSQQPDAFKLVYFELSHYRKISQQHGADMAQSLAEQFAARLRQHLHFADELFRYGTNSFMAIVPASGFAECQHFFQHIASQLVENHQKGTLLSWGVGHSEYPRSGTNSRHLIRSAQKIHQRFGPH